MKLLIMILLFTGLSAKYVSYCIDVNLKSDGMHRTLDACMNIDTPLQEFIVQHNMIVIFSSKTVDEISSKLGKEKVLKQLQDAVDTNQSIYLSKFMIK
jgi:flagellar basal body-associated protein FliL